MRWLVLIVDDHPLVGEAFELSIRASYPHLDVGRVTSAEAAEIYSKKHGDRIKLVLLDLMLPDVTGYTAVMKLQALLPDIPIAIVSSRDDAHSVAMARTFDVAGYLSKSTPMETLVSAVGAFLRGETVFPETSAPPAPVAVDFQKRLATLSGAQLRVLVALADGKLNKQIAHDLDITEGTVKQHLNVIFRKLGVTNRSQAILAARPYLISDGRD